MLLAEVLAALDPQPGQVVVDCTLGFAGHSVELLQPRRPDGLLDRHRPRPRRTCEPARREAARPVGASVRGCTTQLRRPAERPRGGGRDGSRWRCSPTWACRACRWTTADRGFSFMRDGPLDMRMDRTRGRTAAELLNTLSAGGTGRRASATWATSREADAIAAAIVEQRGGEAGRAHDANCGPDRAAPRPVRVDRCARRAAGTEATLGPATRVFQALRILVNRELANLTQLLRVLPDVLKPGGRGGGHQLPQRRGPAGEGGVPRRAAPACTTRWRPTRSARRWTSARANPRSRSAKLRWRRLAGERPA